MLLKTGFRLTSRDVILAFDQEAKSCKSPVSMTVDHGTEFNFLAIDDWVHVNHVSLVFIRPGKPTDNGLCRSFNGRTQK